MTDPNMGCGAFLTEKQAARLLSVSHRTLQTWRRKGAGPCFVKLGRAVRYRQHDLFAWANAHRHAG
jgi:excisionase family DNA binding protein